jgi:hypothetical protein
MDFSFWDRHRVGLLANAALAPEIRQARVAFTRAQLRRAEKLQSLLKFAGPERPASLAVMNVVNHGTDTVDAAYLGPRQGEFLFDVDDLRARGLDPKKLFAPGDGTVTSASSALPAALLHDAKIIDSRLAHDRLFDEPRLKNDLQRLFSPRKE